jgi:hypothetical protein
MLFQGKNCLVLPANFGVQVFRLRRTSQKGVESAETENFSDV